MPSVLVFPDGRPYHKFDLEGKFAIGQSIDGRLYAGGTSGVLRYPDGNQDDNLDTWEPATIGLGNVHVNSIEVDPTDPGVLYQGLSDLGPYKSIDQGKTFHRILGTGWPVTVENFVWNGPYYSNYEYCMLSCSADCSSNGRIAGGGATGFAISNQDTNVIYSTFGSGSGQSAHGGVNKSTDGGATWVPVGFQLENGFELNQDSCVPYGFRYLEMVVNNDQVVFAAQENPETGEGILYKTTNGGDIWEKVYVADRFMTGLAVSPLDPDLVVFTTRIAAYKSEQGGAPDSWQEMTPDGVTNIRTIRLSPHQRDVFVIGSHVQGIYYTDDGGQTWQQNALSGLFRQQVSQDNEEILPPDIATAFNTNQEMLKNISSIIFDPVEPDAFYVGSRQPNRAGFGVAKITNAGQNWDRLPLEGMTYRNVFDMAIDSKGQYLYIGTFNGTYMFNLR
jgi:hypothetical protein